MAVLLARRAMPSLVSSLAPARAALQSSAWQPQQQRWFSDGQGSVTEVTTNEEYRDAIQSGSLVVADFTAAWCGPCRQMAPFFDKLSAASPSAKFIKVDIDSSELSETVASENISAVPTFILYKNKEKVSTIMGANTKALQDAVEEHSG